MPFKLYHIPTGLYLSAKGMYTLQEVGTVFTEMDWSDSSFISVLNNSSMHIMTSRLSSPIRVSEEEFIKIDLPAKKL